MSDSPRVQYWVDDATYEDLQKEFEKSEFSSWDEFIVHIVRLGMEVKNREQKRREGDTP